MTLENPTVVHGGGWMMPQSKQFSRFKNKLFLVSLNDGIYEYDLGNLRNGVKMIKDQQPKLADKKPKKDDNCLIF